MIGSGQDLLSIRTNEMQGSIPCLPLALLHIIRIQPAGGGSAIDETLSLAVDYVGLVCSLHQT